MTERERLTTGKRKIFARESLTLMSMSKDELRQHYNEIFDRLQEYEVAEENNQIIVPPCKVGDTIWVIDREDGEAVDISGVKFLAKSKGCIIATTQINDYDLNEIIGFHINETQDNFDTHLMVYSDDDCFLTREEAERRLKELNKGAE